MNLISKIEIDNTIVKFYDGIDLEILTKHPKDGSGGFIFCFIDKWLDEVKKHHRESKIDSILTNSEYKEFNSLEIDNNYVCIYQTDGYLEAIYESIKKNIHKKIGKPWLTLSGSTRGNIIP